MPSTIGRYQIVDRLATGGMADVFLVVALDDDQAEPLVLKRILPHLAQDNTFIHMFLQEARIAMAVVHPNVVQIHRLSEHQGLPFLVMDFVDGLTFRQLSRAADEVRRPIPLPVAMDLITQACTGAHAVHQTQIDGLTEIVHRDLCPHNLMVDLDGTVRLLDFGIAKAAQGMDTTRTGVLKGKTAYLAPEQVRSGPVDRRTDLWSLSVVAWELLSGTRLFKDVAEYDVLQRIVQGDLPRLDAVRPDLPSALVETVHHSLHPDPERRFPDALALRQALLSAAERADMRPDRHQTRTLVRTLAANAPPAAEPVPSSVPPRTSLPIPTAEPPAPRRTGAWIAVFALLTVLVFGASAGVGAWYSATVPLDGDPITLTFAPILPPARMAEELEPLRRDLERAVSRPIHLQIAPSYGAAGNLLTAGRTDVAVLPPQLYLQVRASLGSDLTPLAMTEVDRARGVDGVLIAHQDQPWEGAESVRGATLCLTDPSSATGYALPRRWLRDRGLDLERDLAGIHLSGDHHRVITDVAEGRCAFGAVYSGALRGAVDTQVPVHLTRQVQITGHTPNDAVCAGPHTDPQLVRSLRDALLAWTPDGGALGASQRLTGFVALDDGDYDPLRRALEPSDPPETP